MATTRSQKMCLGHQVSVPQLHKNRGKNPRVQRKGLSVGALDDGFQPFSFHFHSYLRRIPPMLTFAAYFLKMAWWVKNHQRIVIFRVLGAGGFALQNLPETLGIFSSKTSQWQTFLAVFLTGKLEDFLVFFFCWGNQEAIYLHHICAVIRSSLPPSPPEVKTVSPTKSSVFL